MERNKSSLANYPCQYLKGVGPKNALKLQKLGIETAQDILFHLPLRYEDRTQLTPLNQLNFSDNKQSYVVLGKIIQVSIMRKPKPQLYCLIADDTGQLILRFIHYARAQQQNLVLGGRIFAVGEVRQTHAGLEMIHPEYRLLSAEEAVPLSKTLTPIYPTTEGLSQRSWLQFSEQALMLLNQGADMEETLSEAILSRLHFPHLQKAIVTLHRPSKNENFSFLNQAQHPAQRRLVLEELLAHRLAMIKRREYFTTQAAIAFTQETGKLKSLLSSLPFELTAAQKRVVEELRQDLKKTHPMMRLLQGDVGSGKTIVAAIVALSAVENNTQVAIMAPTELLAEQHYRVIEAWLKPLDIHVALLKGGLNKRIRLEIVENLASGKIDILIGTHALFQEGVHFKQLSLMIIDEQHRFGVHQRLALKEKGMRDGKTPHQLIMTATPIPRTLAMSLYADLDYSVIDELPAGRKPIMTLALSNDKRDDVMQRIQNLCMQGQQVYWVCPLIEESEIMQCQAAEKSYEQLSLQLSVLKIALLHGKMKAKEKEVIMRAFKEGEINVLVATTVIEVGVDVPNASLMVIENAERLGLAQLHQLRGRVGRGCLSSYCVLLYQAPLGRIAKERIAMMRESQDGFKIAEKDLELRGAGEMLGARQTGDMNFRIANLARDQKWLLEAQEIADILWKSSPALCNKIITRWLGQKEDLVGV
ncbi:MAG: ATP-dependent DNA helicase RecG [Gammaproteobacteria bacterium]|nr:ATP-dependent DNA helicase RecG [Gammaproteobacteria bacterium]